MALLTILDGEGKPQLIHSSQIVTGLVRNKYGNLVTKQSLWNAVWERIDKAESEDRTAG